MVISREDGRRRADSLHEANGDAGRRSGARGEVDSVEVRERRESLLDMVGVSDKVSLQLAVRQGIRDPGGALVMAEERLVRIDARKVVDQPGHREADASALAAANHDDAAIDIGMTARRLNGPDRVRED